MALEVNRDKLPDVVYKYREFNPRNLDTLFKNQLYFARPSTLNDPFDASIPQYYGDMTDTELMNFVELHRKPTDPFQSASEIRSRLSDGYPIIDGWASVDRRIGICSFSSIKNSLVLWSLYADSHEGFCIGYDMDSLYNDIETWTDELKEPVLPFLVEYATEFPKIGPKSEPDTMRRASKLLTTKALEYSFERELRLINSKSGGIPLPISPETVVEIAVGAKASTQDRRQIEDYAENINTNVRILNLCTHPRRFELITRVDSE